MLALGDGQARALLEAPPADTLKGKGSGANFKFWPHLAGA
jgi:hypothetical protein